jgi:alpha-galactosidase
LIDARIDFVKNQPTAVEPIQQEAYILTPPLPDQPRINGPSVLGATPGKPVIYRVPVTGKSPIELNISGLPSGLSFNSVSRVISGKAPAKGDYPLEIVARNESGEDTFTLTIKTGAGLALTPPLGWNSWNVRGSECPDQEKVKAAADAMNNSGLADHGWSYINIDDGWEAGRTYRFGRTAG